MTPLPSKTKALTAATWSAIALGFFIPIATATSNLLLALTALLFALSGDYRGKARAIGRNPVALACLLFFALTLLGSLYGLGAWHDKQHYLGKYLTLLAVPLLAPLFAERASRIYALAAFCAAMLLTLALSYAIRFGWLPPGSLPMMDAADPVVFKLSITHGFLMAIAAFLLAVAAHHTDSLRARWVLAALAALAAFNVLFMVFGRTGYVVLAVLGVYFFFRRFGARGIAIAAVGFALACAAAYQWSSAFHERTDMALDQASAWREGRGDRTSIGLRLDYYSNTLAIIRAQPLFGVGTGGFALAYGERVQHTGMAPSNNPHNQYLLITAQLGVVGLAALIALYAVYWRGAGRLTPPFGEIARGLLLAMLVGNLFNSFMLDFTERLFFAWLSGVLFAELSARRDDSNTG